MDRQNRVGSKAGGGGVASWSETNADRRERLRKLALETIDLSTDPYFMKNHLGSYECKLCLTVHSNEGSYLAHTQGKKHQTNLARRAAREAKDTGAGPTLQQMQMTGAASSSMMMMAPKRTVVKIGRPGYKVTKVRNESSKQMGLLFQIMYPEIAPAIQPRYRFMSAFEQKVEVPDRAFQYVLFAAEPYETIAFKIPSTEIDRRVMVDSSSDGSGGNGGGEDATFLTHWDPDSKQYYLQFMFKVGRRAGGGGIPKPE